MSQNCDKELNQTAFLLLNFKLGNSFTLAPNLL